MYHTIVCAIGLGSRERARHLIETSSRFLTQNGVLHLVHVAESLPSTSSTSPDTLAMDLLGDAEKKLSEVSRFLETPPILHVRTGRAAQIILAVAKEVHADLIVVAAHREDIFDKLFGSTVDQVVHKAHCSVHIDRPAVAKIEPSAGK